MKIEVRMYNDEFNTHKQLNIAVLEEVLKQLPAPPSGVVSEILHEHRGMLFDTLFDEAACAVMEYLARRGSIKLDLKFQPEVKVEEHDARSLDNSTAYSAGMRAKGTAYTNG